VLVASPAKEVLVGDVVSVRVFGQDAFSVRTAVREQGMITVPLIGDVKVLGRQPAEVSKEIAKRLEPYVNQPHVMMVVEESRVNVVMAGEIQRPGTLTLDASVDLLTAIANAGGLTQFAGESDIYVLRRGSSGTTRIRFRWDEVARGIGNSGRFRLRDGDQVVVE
jgi:polysaccharide export outer membrane protein